jgi:hypothetical protein
MAKTEVMALIEKSKLVPPNIRPMLRRVFERLDDDRDGLITAEQVTRVDVRSHLHSVSLRCLYCS